jgi:hypothetical protein
VKIGLPLIQVHAKEQAHQTQIMIAMHVADKNGFQAMEIPTKAAKLHLRALASIHQKVMLTNLNVLRCWITAQCR